MKKMPLIIFLISLSSYGFTQKNSIYFELVGPTYFYSINYERVISTNYDESFGLIAGVGFSDISYIDNGWSTLIPIRLKGFKKNKNHVTEFGAAVTPVFNSICREVKSSFSLHIGYKYLMFHKRRFYVGAEFTPTLNTLENCRQSDTDLPAFFLGGVRFGYGF